MSAARAAKVAMIAAVGLAVAGVVATGVIRATVAGTVPRPVEGTAPATAALGRCRERGEAASADAACQALWRAARAAFLEPSRGPGR